MSVEMSGLSGRPSMSFVDGSCGAGSETNVNYSCVACEGNAMGIVWLSYSGCLI